jgi:hypothetical protein
MRNPYVRENDLLAELHHENGRTFAEQELYTIVSNRAAEHILLSEAVSM